MVWIPRVPSDRRFVIRRITLTLFGRFIFVLCLLAAPTTSNALMVDLTLGSSSAGSQITFEVGLQDTGGSPVSINGYTLGFEFDVAELQLAGVSQEVSFGGLGVVDFATTPDCATGRCSAGNVPGSDSPPVGLLFSVTFDVISVLNDGLVDFRAGILDSLFEGIAAASGEPVFEIQTGQVSATLPEPGRFLLLGLALASLLFCQRATAVLKR